MAFLAALRWLREAVLGAGTPLTRRSARRLRRHHCSPSPPAAAPPRRQRGTDTRLTIGLAATLVARVMIMSTRGMPGGLPRPVDLN